MDNSPRGHPFRCPPLRVTPWPTLNRAVQAAVDRLLRLEELDDLYRGLPSGTDPVTFIADFMQALGVEYSAESGLEAVPRSGPLLVLSNHPMGPLDGMALLLLLNRVRGDTRVIVNSWMKAIPEWLPLFFTMRWGDPESHRNLRRALRWLQGGGSIINFPAGVIARFDPQQRRIRDGRWLGHASLLIRRSGCSVLPVHVAGRYSLLFHLVRYWRPPLDNALLPREMLLQRGRRVALRFGPVIPAERLVGMSDAEMLDYLRRQSEALADP